MLAVAKRSSRKRKPKKALKATPVVVPPRREPLRVLLALDGSRASNAALRLARRMAGLGAWAPQAITVTQPLPTYVGDFVLPTPPLAQETIRNNVLLNLRTQLRRHGLPDWPANVRFGPTGWSIVEAAHELSVQLIVVGLGRHGRIARLFGAETASKVVRKSDLPVLAVHSSIKGLPRVAVVAMDFGESSIAAAKDALNLLQPGGELHLVHAMSSFNTTSIADSAWRLSYADAVQSQFARVTALLEPMTAGVVKTKLATGGVVDVLTSYATSVRAELIAAGRHNQGLVERMLLGSTPSELLRESPCSVLISPAPSMAGA